MLAAPGFFASKSQNSSGPFAVCGSRAPRDRIAHCVYYSVKDGCQIVEFWPRGEKGIECAKADARELPDQIGLVRLLRRGMGIMIAAAPRRNSLSAASNQSERGSDEWPSMRESLAQIVAACRQGDRGAQRELYDHCSPKVFRLVVHMVGIQEAADVTQQIFLQTYRTLQQFSARSGFETWLYRLATNECLQFLRHTKRRSPESLDYEPADRSAGHTRELQSRELLDRALQRLDPELRAIFLLREVEGFDYRELAETLKISEGTVASRLNRARSKLKEYLLDLGWEL